MAVTTQELCEKIGVKNEVFISDKMKNFDQNFNEDDYYEILITLLSSIQKSQADFNYGIINFMSKNDDIIPRF